MICSFLLCRLELYVQPFSNLDVSTLQERVSCFSRYSQRGAMLRPRWRRELVKSSLWSHHRTVQLTSLDHPTARRQVALCALRCMMLVQRPTPPCSPARKHDKGTTPLASRAAATVVRTFLFSLFSRIPRRPLAASQPPRAPDFQARMNLLYR